ncbi:MAG TPA: hypothetical protein VKB23_02925 [Solirubrobacterales bacterium]|nr:hypothetical protein [Solirubrobacterales bacterium]
MSEKDTLIEALFKLYSDAGTEVTYVTDDGRTLAYWPKRYLQALRRAVDEDNVIGFVEGLVTRDASRGFGYLADAGRLDLTVEAVIVERFSDLFPPGIIKTAESRLLNNGYHPDISAPSGREPAAAFTAGSKLLIELTIDENGKLEARLAG